MLVVAEGAEMEAEVAQLKALGCDFSQGYFFSRPIDKIEITTLLRAASTQKILTTSIDSGFGIERTQPQSSGWQMAVPVRVDNVFTIV